MRNRLGRTILSLLLSVLVLASGIVPPSITHCHAGGSDNTHRHGNPHEAVHDLAHDHSLPHEHSLPHYHSLDRDHDKHPTKSGGSVVSDSVVHLHMWWLGIELSLPASDNPVDNDDNGDSDPTAIAAAMDEILMVTQTGQSLDRVIQAATRTRGLDVVSDLKPMLRTWVAASISLCDSARLERSGVLLL